MNLAIFCLTIRSSWILAASTRRADRMGRRFQPEEALISPEQLLLLIGVLLVFAVLVWSVSNWIHRRQGRIFDSPRSLFRELCRAHGLSSPQRQLLHDIAGWYRLPNAASLFLERELLDSPALTSAMANRDQIQEVREILFSDKPSEESILDGTVDAQPLGTWTQRFRWR